MNSAQINEATVVALIDKMLEEQGWDYTNPAIVEKESYISDLVGVNGKKSGRPDYILNNNDGKPLAVIECKAGNIDPKFVTNVSARNDWNLT